MPTHTTHDDDEEQPLCDVDEDFRVEIIRENPKFDIGSAREAELPGNDPTRGRRNGE